MTDRQTQPSTMKKGMNRQNDKEGQSHKRDLSDAGIGEGFEPAGIFQQLKKRITGLELYQIFVERPKIRRSSLWIYLLILLVSVWGYVCFVGLFEPPFTFDELDVIEGTYESYNRKARSGNSITIRLPDGKKRRFDTSIDWPQVQKLESIKGRSITFYYSKSFSIFFTRTYTIQAIKFENEFIEEYTIKEYERRVRMYNFGKTQLLYSPVIITVLLFFIYMMNRKPGQWSAKKEGGENGED